MDRIIIATQVVEAGVDISGRTLITELAPWASIVQRIGRCNRTGEDGPGQVYWIDLDERLSLPYLSDSTSNSPGAHVEETGGESVSPKALDDFKRANEKPINFCRSITNTFFGDATCSTCSIPPDLSGNDIDIQRFVRSDDPDTDVQVFWRDIPGDAPSSDEPAPTDANCAKCPSGRPRLLRVGREENAGPDTSGITWMASG